jgi:PAS domain S-box-containing protein
MRGGIGCPVVAGEAVSGVLTFFYADGAPPDAALLDVLFQVGAQLGQVVERTNAERRLRESEDRYRRLVEMAPEAVLLLRRGRVVYANSAAAAMFGAGSADELADALVFDHVAGGDREEVRRRYPQAAPGEAVSTSLDQLVRLDGSLFDAEVRSQPIGLAGEAASLAIIRDVTDRRRDERLQSEFISIVSHELRTPINTLMGALDLLGSRMLGEFPPQAHRMIDIAMNNTLRLKRLVNDMLDIQLLEWGRLPFFVEAADASDLLLQARDAMQPLAVQREVALEVTPLRAPVAVDVDRMGQVFANLVGNALKYTPEGGRVALSAEVCGAEVVFEVRDDGRGIPTDQLATIFEKFQQVAPGEARERGGAGLGLAIARGLVERHGGRIWAESAPGEGSRFYVAVPLADDEAPGA